MEYATCVIYDSDSHLVGPHVHNWMTLWANDNGTLSLHQSLHHVISSLKSSGYQNLGHTLKML